MGTGDAPPLGTNIESEGPDVEPTVETDEATYTDDAELERTIGLSGGRSPSPARPGRSTGCSSRSPATSRSTSFSNS